MAQNQEGSRITWRMVADSANTGRQQSQQLAVAGGPTARQKTDRNLVSRELK
jgi:hypothetical protein